MAGLLNDLWRCTMTDSEPPPSEEPQICPPLHQHINNTCIPLLLDCSSSSSDDCLLECESNNDNSGNNTSNCVIDGDLTLTGSVPTVNGSIVDTNTISIVGVINVTGSVVVAEKVKVKLSIGSVLHVGKCLVVEDESEIVVVIESGNEVQDGSEAQLLATYDSECSSSELVGRVRIETTSSFDECEDGRPTIVEQVEDEKNERSRLELLFVPMDGSSECGGDSSESEMNILVIAVVVPIVVLVILVIVIVMAVPSIREKVVPVCQ